MGISVVGPKNNPQKSGPPPPPKNKTNDIFVGKDLFKLQGPASRATDRVVWLEDPILSAPCPACNYIDDKIPYLLSEKFPHGPTSSYHTERPPSRQMINMPRPNRLPPYPTRTQVMRLDLFVVIVAAIITPRDARIEIH